MSALFDFPSMLVVVLLLICTATYARSLRPSLFNTENTNPNASPSQQHTGFIGFAWKISRIGERCSFEVACCLCVAAFYVLFIK